jgi:hypothetical protein
MSTRNRNESDKLNNINVRVLQFALFVVFIGAAMIIAPRVISSDPCLRDWDIECTTVDTATEVVHRISEFFILPVVANGAIIVLILVTITNFFTKVVKAVQGRTTK